MAELVKKEEREGSNKELTRGGQTFVPRVDIVETEHELLLYADLPGVNPGDLDIRFEKQELTIHGKVAPRREGEYLYSEYGVGDYYRTFTISEMIDSGKISAELANGVLLLHLPKAEAAKPRRIEVKAR